MIDILTHSLLTITWQAAVIFLAVLLLLLLFGERLEARWRYLLWCVVLLRLALPILPASPWGLWQSEIFTMPTMPSHIVLQENIAEIPAYRDDINQSTNNQSTTRKLVPNLAVNDALDDLPITEIVMTETASQEPTIANVSDRLIHVDSGKTIPTVVSIASQGDAANGVYDMIRHSKIGFLCVWITGILLFGVRLVHGEVRLLRRSRYWTPANDPQLLALLHECRQLLRIRREVTLLLAPGEIGAASCGLLRPRIIISETVAKKLPANALRMVLLHELTHIRRFDPIVQRAALVLSVIHWLNPVVWFVMSRLQRDRELACDAAVLHILGSQKQKEYGKVVLVFAGLFSAHERLPGLVGVFRKQGMIRRIEMIANYKNPKRRHALLGAMLITLVAAFGLTKAQPPQPPQPAELANQQQIAEQSNDIAEVIHPFPPESYGLIFRFRDAGHRYSKARSPHFSYDRADRLSGDLALIVAEPDDVFVFDGKQSLWRNERTNETFFELYPLGIDSESGKKAIYRLSSQYESDKDRLTALGQRNKVDQRHWGYVTMVKLTAGNNLSPNHDYIYDVEAGQWLDRDTDSLIPLEEFRKLQNLEVRVQDEMYMTAANASLTWKNRGESMEAIDLPHIMVPYHQESLDAPSPLPANTKIRALNYDRFFPLLEKANANADHLLYESPVPYARLSPDDVLVFENNQWRNETTGMTAPDLYVEGNNGIYALKRGVVAKLTFHAESKQSIYSYRDGRWLNLETGESTSREALEQEENLKLSIYAYCLLAKGSRIRVSNQARKISVLDSSSEPFPNPEKRQLPDLVEMDFYEKRISTLEENDVYVFTDRGWKNPKTGQLASRVIFEARPGVTIYLSRTDYGIARYQRLEQEEFGVTGTGKYVRLSDGGMTIETADVPFEMSDAD